MTGGIQTLWKLEIFVTEEGLLVEWHLCQVQLREMLMPPPVLEHLLLLSHPLLFQEYGAS